MKKHIRKARKHVDENKHEMFVLSVIAIVVSLLYIVTQTRERFIIPLLSKTHSDTLVRLVYFDRASDPGLYMSLGDYYFGRGPVYDLEKARKYYLKTLSLDERYELANYQTSRTYFIAGDQVNALTYINKEIEYHPDFGRSHYIKGLIYGYTNRLPEAVDEFKLFLVWKPDSWAGHNDLAWVYFQKGDFQNALLTAQEGLRFSPNNPWLLNTIGISYKNLGNESAALGAFTLARSAMNSMSPEKWGQAYPGNDPDFYQTGLSNMQKTIEQNISLIQNK